MNWLRLSLSAGFRSSQCALSESSSWICRVRETTRATKTADSHAWMETHLFFWDFTCCSLVHSLGTRTRKFYKTERNFEIIRARAFTVKLSHTLPLEPDCLLNLAIDTTQKAKFTVQKYSTASWGVSTLWCLRLKYGAWPWLQMLMPEWESIKP